MDACAAAGSTTGGAAVVAAVAPRYGPQLGGYHGGAAAPEAGATALYVAPGGSDASGDGSEAKPFATLQKAQAAVRKTPVASRPATAVYLRAGTHYVGETLTFTPAVSGASAAAPVVWSAYPGENVTVSGGVPLSTSAKPLSWSSAGAPLTATLPAGAPLNFSTLFVDNERAIWARYPNGNNKDITGMCFSKAQRPGEVAHAGVNGCPVRYTAVPLFPRFLLADRFPRLGHAGLCQSYEHHRAPAVTEGPPVFRLSNDRPLRQLCELRSHVWRRRATGGPTRSIVLLRRSVRGPWRYVCGRGRAGGA